MLELKGIGKDFRAGLQTITAVDDVTLSFGEHEFVAVLGKSGAGKTTLLNMIGGLCTPTCGEILFRGQSTSSFTERQWDSYRNNSIGYVFQSYSLLNHLTVLENVMLAMLLSGATYKERKERAIELLTKFGLEEHLKSKPTQLSGGEQQRVVIARAIANDPDILLCDEPTGFLDYESSIEIMEILKQESENRLVIMVTHNIEMARLFVDRIITIDKGRIFSDSRPGERLRTDGEARLNSHSMSLLSSLVYAAKGLRLAQLRRILMVLGYSFGILCIALALQLSFGFRDSVQDFQSEIMARFPIVITSNEMKIKNEDMKAIATDQAEEEEKEELVVPDDAVVPFDPTLAYTTHQNLIDEAYLDYIHRIDPDICSEIATIQGVTLNFVSMDEEGNGMPLQITQEGSSVSSNNLGVTLATFPESTDGTVTNYLESNYDLVAGRFPQYNTDLCLVIDDSNRLDAKTLANLGFTFAPDEEEASEEETGEEETEEEAETRTFVSYDELVGKQLYLIHNDDYYVRGERGFFEVSKDYTAMVNSENTLTTTIVGVLRAKDDDSRCVLRNGIVYNSELASLAVERAVSSRVVIAQRTSPYNVLTGEMVDEATQDKLEVQLCGERTPSSIILYPKDFGSKQAVLTYLDSYNTSAETEEQQVYYKDLAKEVTGSTASILKGVSAGLLLVTVIALINCFLLIFLVTADSVKRRQKEIGVLRALGIRRGSVLGIFLLQTMLIGLITGLVGVVASYYLIGPFNEMIEAATGLSNVLVFDLQYAWYLVVLSIVLSAVAAFFPTQRAVMRDPAEILTVE